MSKRVFEGRMGSVLGGLCAWFATFGGRERFRVTVELLKNENGGSS